MEWTHKPGVDTLTSIINKLLSLVVQGQEVTIPQWLAYPVMLLCIIIFIAVLALVLIWGERKVSARIQMRVGPMMTGPKFLAQKSMWLGGLLQSGADAIKLLTKELIIPSKADPFPFVLAPIIIVAVCICAFVVVPFAPAMSVSDLNIGIVHIVSISSLTVLSILMAGWSSNNKYSLLGGLRAASQMLSYEIPLIFALLGPILLAGTLSMQGIVQAQRELGMWFAVPSFLGFVIYYISSIAEVNRPPFDIPEAESELVQGFVTEYSGLMFSMFFLAEFANMFLVCAVATTVFLGGWMVPFVAVPEQASLGYTFAALAVFMVKTNLLVFLMMWVRWTFPRVRPDHLMNFGWKYLFPLALVNLALCATIAILKEEAQLNAWALAAVSMVALLGVAVVFQLISKPKPHAIAAGESQNHG